MLLKIGIPLIIILCFWGCIGSYSLNKRIDSSQRESLISSPFQSAGEMIVHLDIHKKYRRQYQKVLSKLLTGNSRDTIFLVESYDEICLNCPADYVYIFINNKMIRYWLKGFEKRYKKKTEILEAVQIALENATYKGLEDSRGYIYSEIPELLDVIKEEGKWNQNPKRYGHEDCFDGGHTFYTVFLPEQQIESMYIRCWIPKYYRVGK